MTDYYNTSDNMLILGIVYTNLNKSLRHLCTYLQLFIDQGRSTKMLIKYSIHTNPLIYPHLNVSVGSK